MRIIHIFKYLSASMLLVLSTAACHAKNTVWTFENDTYKISHHKEQFYLRSITENDQEKLQNLIETINLNHSSNENSLKFQEAVFYIKKANERQKTSAFYGVISEDAKAFFPLGFMRSIYGEGCGKMTETTKEDLTLNTFFVKRGLIQQTIQNENFHPENLKNTKNMGIAVVSYAFDPSLTTEDHKGYWQTVIEIVQHLREDKQKLPDESFPEVLACFVPTYDQSTLKIMKLFDFTIAETSISSAFYPKKDRLFVYRSLK